MGIFDQALSQSYSPYISKFVGSALPELKESSSVFQKRYEDNLQHQSDLDFAVNSLKVDDADYALKKAQIDKIKGVIDSVAKDQGAWERAAPIIRKATSEFTGNEALKAAMENKGKYDKEEELYNQMVAQGHTPLRFSKRQATLGADGKIFRYASDQQKQLDYDTRKQSFFDKMMPDASPIGLSEASAEFMRYGSTQGISNKKIANYLDEATKRYETTPEYTQEMRKLTEIDGLSKAEARKSIQASLLSVGKERVFSQTDFNYAHRPQGSGKEEKPGDPAYRVETDPMVPINQKPPIDLDKLDKKIRGSSFMDAASSAILDQGGSYQRKGRDAEYGKLTPQEKETFDNVAKIVGGKTLDEKMANVKRYFEHQKNSKFANQYQATKDPSLTAENSKYLIDNMTSRAWYDPETGKTMTGTDFYNNIYLPAISEKGSKKELRATGKYGANSIFADITGNPQFSAPHTVQLGGKTYAASMADSELNSDTGKFTVAMNRLTGAMRSGVPQDVPSIKGEIKATSFFKDGKYILEIKDKGGKPIKDNEGKPITVEATSPHQAYLEYLQIETALSQ